jgi:hypothetical protein
MKEFTAETQVIETASSLNVISQHQKLTHYPAYIGLDVHKDTIALAVAETGREAPQSRGEIANKPGRFRHITDL